MGRVVRAHGIQGEVVVHRFGESESVLTPGSMIRFGSEPGDILRKVQTSQVHGRDWLVTFEGLGSRGEAEAVRGKVLYVRAETLPELPAGSYYRFQLVGLRVKTQDGRDLGTIEEILEGGAQDVCVVRGKDGEILIPAVQPIVSEVDVDKGVMIVDPVPGLVPETETDKGSPGGPRD